MQVPSFPTQDDPADNPPEAVNVGGEALGCPQSGSAVLWNWQVWRRSENAWVTLPSDWWDNWDQSGDPTWAPQNGDTANGGQAYLSEGC